MKTEYKIFGGVAAFLFARPPSTAGGRPRGRGQLEWIGIVALVLSGLLCAMCGGFFWFVARRIDLRPEDRETARSPTARARSASSARAATGRSAWRWPRRSPAWAWCSDVVADRGRHHRGPVRDGGLLFEYYTGARRAH